MEGPVTSASRMPTRRPSRFSCTASADVTSDLPTPPLPLTTASTCPMRESALGASCRLCGFAREGQSSPQAAQSCVQVVSSMVVVLLAVSTSRPAVQGPVPQAVCGRARCRQGCHCTVRRSAAAVLIVQYGSAAVTVLTVRCGDAPRGPLGACGRAGLGLRPARSSRRPVRLPAAWFSLYSAAVCRYGSRRPVRRCCRAGRSTPPAVRVPVPGVPYPPAGRPPRFRRTCGAGRRGARGAGRRPPFRTRGSCRPRCAAAAR